MPELRREVLEAFALLNLSSDCGASEAAKAYKTEALRHHPDKNLGDPGAIQRFQEVGAAWDTLQRHYEDPSSSYVRNFPQASDDDDGFSPDLSFFMFMFEEMLFERYSRGSRREYRSRRGGGGPAFSFGIGRQGPIFFTAQPSSYYSSSGRSSGGYSQLRESENDNVQNQTRQKAAYEKRLKEFEQEIEAEKRDLAKRAAEKSKDENRRVAAYQQAFLAARTGKTSTVISLVNEYHLDVNSPEKIPKTTGKKATTNFQTLLHAACRAADEDLILFLLDKGAIPDALNDAKLHPFHVAISCGNLAVVKFFLLRRVNGRFTPGCHPSKAAPDGRTPLQIAIAGGKPDMIALMTKEATVHDVERCWQQTDDAEFKEILSTKKGFVDPETKELVRQEAERKAADERAKEEQRVAEERARLAEKARIKEENVQKAQQRAAEKLARQREQEAEEEKKREAQRIQQRKEAEEAAHRKAELEARQKMAAEARRRAEYEARVQAEAEAARQAAEARSRAEAQARQLAQEQERARQQAEEEARKREEEARQRKAARAEAKRIQREAEAEAVRQQEARQAAAQAEALRVAAAESARVQETESYRREQQRLEAKRAETLRRLQAQAEEHRRQAEARSEGAVSNEIAVPAPGDQEMPRRKVAKNKAPRDVSELSPEELEKRAAQSARDKARIAEERRRKMEEKAKAMKRPDTPESKADDYIPPTPVSMPSPSQRRADPPLIPHHTRPNVRASVVDSDGALVLGPEDIQTGAIADDLFAPAPKAGTSWRESAAAPNYSTSPFRGYGRGRGYRGRGSSEWRGRGRGVVVE